MTEPWEARKWLEAARPETTTSAGPGSDRVWAGWGFSAGTARGGVFAGPAGGLFFSRRDIKGFPRRNGSDSLFGATDRKFERLKRRSDPRPTLCRSGRRFRIPPWRRTNRSWLFAESGRMGGIRLLKRDSERARGWAPHGGLCPRCVSSLSTGTMNWSGPAGRRDSGQRSKKSNGKGAAPPAAVDGRASHPPLHKRQGGGHSRPPPSIRNRSSDPH